MAVFRKVSGRIYLEGCRKRQSKQMVVVYTDVVPGTVWERNSRRWDWSTAVQHYCQAHLAQAEVLTTSTLMPNYKYTCSPVLHQALQHCHLLSKFSLHVRTCGPWLLSWYSDSLRAGRSGDLIPVGTRFSAPIQTGPGAHPVQWRAGRNVEQPPQLTSRWVFAVCSMSKFTFTFTFTFESN